MERVIKENENNDLKYRQGLLGESPKPQGQVFTNLEEASKSIRPEDVEYITD